MALWSAAMDGNCWAHEFVEPAMIVTADSKPLHRWTGQQQEKEQRNHQNQCLGTPVAGCSTIKQVRTISRPGGWRAPFETSGL